MPLARHLILVGFLGFAAASSFASETTQKERHCETLESCVDKLSAVSGHKYISAKSLKGKATLINTEISSENAELIISALLHDGGYARIKESEGVYRVIAARDVRYNSVPLVSASKEVAPSLPTNFDYHMLEYKLDHPSSGKVMARNFRPFLSRYGRVVYPTGSDRIIIQDTAKNLDRIYKLAVNLDKEIDKEVLRELERKEKRHYEVKLQKAKNCKKE